MSSRPLARALVVDDSPTQALEMRMRLVRSGFEVEIAHSGADALAALQRAMPDIVLTDLVMPEMDGLQLTRKIRGAHPGLPVVLLTAHGSEEVAAEALKQGAAGYVPKKFLDRDLPRTLENVLAIARSNRVRDQMLQCMTQSESRYVLDNDPTLVPTLVNRLQENLSRLRLCGENARLRVGMALREALLNAIEHGNLECSSELRARDDDSYHKLTQERRRQSPFADRRVHVTVRETREDAQYVIVDEGPGFDPSKLPDPTDPANLEKPSGRGLLLIRSFMDHVSFNESGNQITLIKRRES
jgi:CheY-like chemotaxis protein